MAASTLKSTTLGGEISSVQSAFALDTTRNIQLPHYVHSKKHGWLQKSAKEKPLLVVNAKVDIPAYLTLRIKVPNTAVRPASGQCLADTGASVCLAGRMFMKSLGMSEAHLTPCDMSVTGANSVSITVLGAMLVEFSSKDGSHSSKQVVYVCEGVSGALLSLEACIDLGVVSESFPNAANTNNCFSAHIGKKYGCDCTCPIRSIAPDVPNEIPFEPIEENVSKFEAWIKDYYSSSAFNCCECQPLPKMHGEPL